MARRKSGKKAKTTRRRRIGGLGKLNASNPIVKFGSIAAGYFLADKVNAAVDKVTGTMDGKLVAGIQTFGGLVLNGTVPMIKKKLPLPLVIVGGVVAGAGVKRGLTEMGVINGFHDVPVLGGYRDVPALGGYNPTPGASMNGYNVPSRVMGAVMFDGADGGLNSDSK